MRSKRPTVSLLSAPPFQGCFISTALGTRTTWNAPLTHQPGTQPLPAADRNRGFGNSTFSRDRGADSGFGSGNAGNSDRYAGETVYFARNWWDEI